MIRTLVLAAVLALAIVPARADAPQPPLDEECASGIWSDDDGTVHGPFLYCTGRAVMPMLASN